MWQRLWVNWIYACTIIPERFRSIALRKISKIKYSYIKNQSNYIDTISLTMQGEG